MGLYKGMEAKLLQTVLTAALMFAAYEKIVNFVFRLLLNRQKVSSKLK
jgi:adenine nucleotide transporter 17